MARTNPFQCIVCIVYTCRKRVLWRKSVTDQNGHGLECRCEASGTEGFVTEVTHTKAAAVEVYD